MTEDNYSLTTEFTLVGFSDHPDLKTLLFLAFLAIYLVTMVGNLGLVTLICMERRLHTPMYIFLGNLALMDSCCSCAITPKMLQNFFSVDRRISLYECMVQFYFLCLAETADCFLLAAMAYDSYVAICNPLQYHTMMSKKLCLQMTLPFPSPDAPNLLMRIEESKIRDTIKEGASKGLKRNQALGKCPEIYKDDTK
ncbi:Olfactory receptor 181 [Cricetulus griseus]|uniref:Olfactory receptor 181 n=1 Tax=Cricetulus griseus TaxID=10029 RepID=G3I3U6_CRIGR|nr:Olfactory receptor 181 [Cricetulus griseus]